MKHWEMTDKELVRALQILACPTLPGLSDPTEALPEEMGRRLQSEAEDSLIKKGLLELSFSGDLLLQEELAGALKEAAARRPWQVLTRLQKGISRSLSLTEGWALKLDEEGNACFYEPEEPYDEALDFLDLPDPMEELEPEDARIDTELLRQLETDAILETGCSPDTLYLVLQALNDEAGLTILLTEVPEEGEPETTEYLSWGGRVLKTRLTYTLDGEFLEAETADIDELLPCQDMVDTDEVYDPDAEEEADAGGTPEADA